MFTGIVQGTAEIVTIEKNVGLVRLGVRFPGGVPAGVQRGASIALDGVCLTVTEFLIDGVTAALAHFDVMDETLRVTTLGKLKIGSTVNFERAASQGAEVGGHILSGHIDCLAQIVAIQRPENNYVITFAVDSEWSKYIFSKGYIAINGTSLTITNAQRGSGETAGCTFDVWLIPETLRQTTFGGKIVGDSVNLEIERQTQVIVDTVLSFLRSNGASLLASAK